MNRGCEGNLNCAWKVEKLTQDSLSHSTILFSVLSDGLLLIIAFDQCLEPGPGAGQRQQRQQRQSEQSLERGTFQP